MFSILIPIYNYDALDLVKELHNQAIATGKPYEILCYDDGSENLMDTVTGHLRKLPYIKYKQLKNNIGRAAIRNKLACDSQYEFLLFIDCDMMVVQDDFISKYLQKALSHPVIVGGIKYSDTPPADSNKILRWTYGHNRETLSINKRDRHPYRSFLTGNFMIHKKVFNSVLFDQSITKYGHEDTLFGLELQKRNIPIKHIENPLIHAGLEEAGVFLDKTRQSVKNLAELIRAGKINRHVKIYRIYSILNRLFATRILYNKYKRNREKWLKNLTSEKPNLKYLDMLKLGLLIESMEEK